MSADEAVRAVCMNLRRECNRYAGKPIEEDINEPLEHGEIQFAEAAIAGYRTHTLSGAGEVERKLRSDIVPGRASRNEAADLIAAQREEIETLRASNAAAVRAENEACAEIAIAESERALLCSGMLGADVAKKTADVIVEAIRARQEGK